MNFRNQRGFTPIELLIVVAIIAIIAAIAFPRLMDSYIRTNAANVLSALREYAEAQKTWRDKGYASIAGNQGGYASSPEARALNADPNAYADNFRNLAYGFQTDVEDARDDAELKKRVALLRPVVANAYYPVDGDMQSPRQATLSGAARVVRERPDGAGAEFPSPASDLPKEFNGYVFAEDRFLSSPAAAEKEMGWNNTFGLIAYPVQYGSTGDRIYWVGILDGEIELRETTSEQTGALPDLLRDVDSPYHPSPSVEWSYPSRARK